MAKLSLSRHVMHPHTADFESLLAALLGHLFPDGPGSEERSAKRHAASPARLANGRGRDG